jgi:hypothetical protein
MEPKFISVEKRKLEFIVKELKRTMSYPEYMDKRFKDIDDKMSKITVGTKMIDVISGVWDDFAVEITKIIDRDNGIVEVFEPGYGPNGQHREMCVLGLKFPDEPRDMKI